MCIGALSAVTVHAAMRFLTPDEAAEEMGYEELQQLCEQLEALHTEQDADMEEWLSLSES